NSPSNRKYTTLKASLICASNLLICSWMKRSDGLSSTARRLRFLLPWGRPRRPLAFVVGGSCPTASEGFSTGSVMTGEDVRRLTLSRDTLRKHRPGTVCPYRDEKNRSKP